MDMTDAVDLAHAAIDRYLADDDRRGGVWGNLE
jgi:hypothetical protein